MKNICELLKIKYPIIAGGMANISDGKFAASVSNAGGLGLIASGGNDGEWMRQQIKIAKSLTNQPFGVNIMLMSPFAAEIAKVVIEEKVKVVTTGAGSPGIYMKDWLEAGVIVIPVVPSVALAKRVQNFGASAVIVEGTEAGGHIGELTTMAFVPQAVDALDIPVIAAGGIGDARGVLAAFALGAKGVQAGTIFLASVECPVHQNYKEKVVAARDIDTVVTGRQNNAAVRVLKNPMALHYLKAVKDDRPLLELEQLTLGSLRKAVVDGDLENGSFMAGQIAGLVSEIKPVKQIIEDLFKDIDKLKKSIEVL